MNSFNTTEAGPPMQSMIPKDYSFVSASTRLLLIPVFRNRSSPIPRSITPFPLNRHFPTPPHSFSFFVDKLPLCHTFFLTKNNTHN